MFNENQRKIKILSEITVGQFNKPFEYVWTREVVQRLMPNLDHPDAEVYYGKKVRTKKQIKLHLENDLDINMFTFSKQPLGVDGEIVRVASHKGYMKSNQSMKPNSLLDSEDANEVTMPENLGENYIGEVSFEQ